MLYSIICLSIVLSLSLSQTIIDTFVDNTDGNILSFDKDHGWKFYEEENNIFDRCKDDGTVTCQVEDSTNDITYYGPFEQGTLYLARDFACNDASIATVRYDVVYCDTGSHGNRDFVRATFENMDDSISVSSVMATKYKIDQTESSTSYDATLIGPLQGGISGSCLNWRKHTISDPIGFNAYAHSQFELSFKFKLDNIAHFAYIFNIEVDCTEANIGTAPLYDGPASHGTEYCLTGLPTETGFDPNGEYILRTDANEELHETNGEAAFEKNDPNGRAYLFEQDTSTTPALDQWYISKDLGSTLVSDVIAICPAAAGIGPDEVALHCTSFTDGNGNVLTNAAIVSGPCIDHTVIGSLFGLFPTDMDEIKVLTLLISLSVLSCIVGMMTCYCCQLIFGYRKTKNYKKVSHKDVDIDF